MCVCGESGDLGEGVFWSAFTLGRWVSWRGKQNPPSGCGWNGWMPTIPPSLNTTPATRPLLCHSLPQFAGLLFINLLGHVVAVSFFLSVHVWSARGGGGGSSCIYIWPWSHRSGPCREEDLCCWKRPLGQENRHMQYAGWLLCIIHWLACLGGIAVGKTECLSKDLWERGIVGRRREPRYVVYPRDMDPVVAVAGVWSR